MIKDEGFISDRSAVIVELMILESEVPGQFHDVAQIIQNDSEDRLGHNTINDLKCRICQLRAELLNWHCRYEVVLGLTGPLSLGSQQYDRRCIAFGTYLSCITLTNRLLGAITHLERVELEGEAQIFANRVLALEAEARSVSATNICVSMAQIVRISRATIASSKDWLHGDDGESGHHKSKGKSREIIAGWKFEQWNTLLGRNG